MSAPASKEPTNKTCKLCDVLKPMTDFVADKRYAYGRENRCKECANKRRIVHVECDDCGEYVPKNYLAKHKAKTCRKPKNDYQHDGNEYMNCPRCKALVKEKTIYRHLKYNICKEPVEEEYQHDGNEYMECPRCKVLVKEKTVYRHVKYSLCEEA